MKIGIIVVYMQRYKHGHEVNFVPPITGIHLAAITPSKHEVRVIIRSHFALPLPSATRRGDHVVFYERVLLPKESARQPAVGYERTHSTSNFQLPTSTI
jgi:hypothetical protein